MMFYYKVGTEKYHNKLQAIQQNLKTGDPVKLITPYEGADFSVEPEQPLQSLITNHLLELRKNYKELKLYYSGGSDSHLILDTIISNGIHVDEIVCLKSGIPTADYEIENYAEPTLKKFKNQLRGTKISIKTPSIDDYRDYYKKGVTEDKIRSGAAGTHNYFRLHWPLDFYGEQPKQDVLHIRGMESPLKKIIKHGEDYYMYLIDIDLEPHANNYQFFSSDKNIQCKEAHMVLKNQSVKRHVNDHSFPPKTRFSDANDNYVDFKGLKLYYHNTKEQLAIEWCWKNCPDLLQTWHENLEQLKDITHNKWWNFGRPELDTVGVLSDFYCLTKKDTKTVDELFPDGFKV